MSPLVLLLTHRRDHYTVDRVADALNARGAKALRVDTDRFPLEMEMELGFGSKGCSARMRVGDRWIRAEEVAAVWLRHLGHPDPGEMPLQYREACATESKLVLEGFLEALRGARWMNPLAACTSGEFKLRQLRVAHANGLRIPETLATNAPGALRAFFPKQRTGLVMKLQAPLSTSMDGSGPAFYTTALQEKDLDDLSTLSSCPPLFQERIAKDAELRVVYVEGRCLAGSPRPGPSAGAREDWRPDLNLRWEEDALPADVEARFDTFMRAMGLNFGAADFIRTPEGEHVFLEINPCGEWGMLERDLGLPISEAIADALLHPRDFSVL